MKLFTLNQYARLVANGEASQADEIDHDPVVTLFTPDANATWLISKIDPSESDRAFGLCDLGMGCPELGYGSIAALTQLREPLRLPVKRDMHFDADKTLTAYAEAARRVGRFRQTLAQGDQVAEPLHGVCAAASDRNPSPQIPREEGVLAFL